MMAAFCAESRMGLLLLHRKKIMNFRLYFLGKRKFFQQRRGLHSIQIPLRDGPHLELSLGKYAKFADGGAVVKFGDTSVMTTAVCRNRVMPLGFVPLTVDYRQKAAAAGRIPTNFLRRELGPTEKEILTARVIDRSLRPLFPKGFNLETQLVCNLMAVDGSNDPDVLAINASSAALALSDIPWNGPVGAVRVGCINDTFITNPTRKQIMKSDLNVVLTGTSKKLTVMLEAEAKIVDKNKFLEAIKHGLDDCASIAEAIENLRTSFGKPKREFINPLDCCEESGALKDMELMCSNKLRSIYHNKNHDKISRDTAIFAIRDDAIAALKQTYTSISSEALNEAFGLINRQIVKELVLEERLRVDSRNFDQLRNISCEVDLHAPLHGSALFQRGQTQVFCTVALDSIESALKSDPMSVLTGALKEKNFFLHYEFPPYATNEIGRTSSSGRRELGHGALAEKALRPIIPKDHPFTIRLTSEVLESNGSSSMATICGGSLSLLDAGVEISAPAAGVAMGLVSKSNSQGEILQHQVLVDILGLEDYVGDMDFKLAGTAKGLTALQADVKIPGLPFQVIREATFKGHEAIKTILEIMNKTISAPRKNKQNWPVTETITIPLTKRGKFCGQGRINLRRITSTTGVQINSTDTEGSWNLFATNREAMDEAKEMISEILKDDSEVELTFGAIYSVKIVEIQDRGVLVDIHPSLQPAFIPVSQLSAKKVSHPSALDFQVGQEIQVKCYGRDPSSGALRLSRKALMAVNPRRASSR